MYSPTILGEIRGVEQFNFNSVFAESGVANALYSTFAVIPVVRYLGMKRRHKIVIFILSLSFEIS